MNLRLYLHGTILLEGTWENGRLVESKPRRCIAWRMIFLIQTSLLSQRGHVLIIEREEEYRNICIYTFLSLQLIQVFHLNFPNISSSSLKQCRPMQQYTPPLPT